MTAINNLLKSVAQLEEKFRDRLEDESLKSTGSGDSSEPESDTHQQESNNPREIFTSYFGDISEKASSLLSRLSGVSNLESVEDSERETLDNLREEVDLIIIEIDREETGLDVQANLKSLEIVHEKLEDLLKRLQESEMSHTEMDSVKNETESLREAVGMKVEAEMMKLQERLSDIRDSLLFLHHQLEGFCVGIGNYQYLTEIPLEYHVFDIIGTFIMSPYSYSRTVCR